jgi:hypothetical protein
MKIHSVFLELLYADRWKFEWMDGQKWRRKQEHFYTCLLQTHNLSVIKQAEEPFLQHVSYVKLQVTL